VCGWVWARTSLQWLTYLESPKIITFLFGTISGGFHSNGNQALIKILININFWFTSNNYPILKFIPRVSIFQSKHSQTLNIIMIIIAFLYFIIQLSHKSLDFNFDSIFPLKHIIEVLSEPQNRSQENRLTSKKVK